MKKPVKKQWKLFSAFFLLVVSDVFLTSYNTPELDMEANPLVLNMGLGWPALITCNILLLIVYYYCAKAAFNYQTLTVSEPLSFRQYLALIFYGDKDKFRWCFTKRLKLWKPFWAMFGFSFCYTMLIARSLTVIEWISVTAGVFWQPYWQLREAMPMDRLDIWIAIPLAFTLFVVWMTGEYKNSGGTSILAKQTS